MAYEKSFDGSLLQRRRHSQQELFRDAGSSFPTSSRRLSGYETHAQESGMVLPIRQRYASMTALDMQKGCDGVASVLSVTPPSSVVMSPKSSLRRTPSILEMHCQQRDRMRARNDMGGNMQTAETDFPAYSARRRMSYDNFLALSPLRRPSDSLQSLTESVPGASSTAVIEAASDGLTSGETSDAFSADTNAAARLQNRSRNRSSSIQRRPSSGRLRSAYACAVSGESWIFQFEQPALASYASFLDRLERDNVCLETIKYYPVYETFRGRVKVRNLCYRKEVLVRASYDCWRSHREFRCHYDELSSQACENKRYDTFAFEIPVPSWQVGCFDFCVSFRSLDCGWWPTYWDNNEGKNYSATYRSPDRGNIDAVIERYEASKQLQPQPQPQQQSFSPHHHIGFTNSSTNMLALRRNSRPGLTSAWLPANNLTHHAYYYDAIMQPSLTHQSLSLPPLSLT